MNSNRLLALPIVIAWLATIAGAQPAFKLATAKDSLGKATPGAVLVEGCSDEVIARFAKLSAPQLAEHMQLFVKSAIDQGNAPPVIGQVVVKENVIRFEPRFVLDYGVEYLVRFRESPEAAWQSHVVALPKKKLQASTVVNQIYPTAAQLPQNLLKFYVYFSAPMTQGEAYRHIELLGPDGKPVAFPFLEIAEELWDKSGQRLTLLLDPARVKRGLVPREEDGPILMAGSSYRLMIKSTWPDAHGLPLQKSFEKKFVVGPDDYRQPDPATWKIETPASKTRDALTFIMPESMDHATFARGVTIEDAQGQVVLGEFTFSREETRAHFTPLTTWRPGLYDVRIWKRIEDLVGNSIDRPFELDRFDTVATSPSARASLAIEIR